MASLNIDRPLDEIVKESRAAKRRLQKEKKQKERDPKEKADGGTDDAAKAAEAKPDTPKVKGGIRKKRRSRGGGGGGEKRDGQVERKVEKKASAASEANGNGTSNGNGGEMRKPNKGAKISVFNLDHGVTQSDIYELFETVGPLRSARLIVLSDGRSSGSAEVVFERMEDALTAISRYNNVPLDNRPLKITLASAGAPIRVSRGRGGGGGGGGGGGRRKATDDEAGTDANDKDKDKDEGRFRDADRDRFDDRAYTRRNARRSRNSRSYDRRASSPGAEQTYND